MTDTADTTLSPAETPARLSPRDESRLALATSLRNLSDQVDEAVPVLPDPAPGQLLRTALDLLRQAEQIVGTAVIAERERGATWEQIGAAAGITRQSAHERWHADVRAWASTGRSALSPNSPRDSLDYAAQADRLYALRHPDRPHAISAGLDATRFPGSREYEQSLRAPGARLHAQIAELQQQMRAVYQADDKVKDSGAFRVRAINREKNAALNTTLADLYERLATAEPSLAEEHRAEAECRRQFAANNREHAELLRQDAARRDGPGAEQP
ncbi:hypothetical protein GCM10010232_67790 [Streptomyces amakusaensis]|uniref:Uncharacterized protein n=1 Tax=Streptomyces amakusaensis TaxID=67271 RepID=A0ABW0ASQ2_9ACTN